MVYTQKGKSGEIYTLYENKKNPNLHYFAAGKSSSGRAIDLPKGYKVVTNKRTGLPLLKKK